MPFVSTKDNGGVRDPNISLTGRPPKDSEDKKKVTRRSLKDRELMALTRKLKPHISSAIMAAANIISNKEATDGNKLKAAALLVNEYHKLIIEIYDGEEPSENEEQPEEIQPQSEKTTIFSLKMVNTEDKE
jgi:hypothetical protein